MTTTPYDTSAPDTTHRPPTPGARAVLRAIATYQALGRGRPSGCRYLPSCSEYGTEAIERHGLWSGGRLALRRLTRCHPFGGHGVDLVPLDLGERSHRS